MSLADVARLAGVTRPAVSNWRRRHDDFPEPVLESEAASLFRVEDVRAWLAEHDKPGLEMDVRHEVSAALNAVRGATTVARCVRASLLVLAGYALDGRIGGTSTETAVSWLAPRAYADVRTLDLDLPTEGAEPVLAELPRLARTYGGRAVCEALLAEMAEGQGRAGGEFATPPSVAALMVALAAPLAGTVVDPSCGVGNLLLAAHTSYGDGPVEILGAEKDDEAWSLAVLRLVVHGLPATVRRGTLPHAADIVFHDAPDRSDFEDSRIHQTLGQLNENGRGFHVSSADFATGSGMNVRWRRALVGRGHVEAVIMLPRGLYQSSGRGAALWVLRPPETVRDTVLLIDATGLGNPKRASTELSGDDIGAIVDRYRNWPDVSAGLPAVSVPIKSLVGGDCVLHVQAWLTNHVDVRERIDRVEVARERYEAPSTTPPTGDRLVAGTPVVRTLHEVVANGEAELFRIARPPQYARKGADGPALIGPDDLHEDWVARPAHRADPSALPADTPRGQPGDVAIAVAGDRVRAAVVREAGAVFAVSMVVLRPRPASADRSLVLAAHLSATERVVRSSTQVRELAVAWPDGDEVARMAGVLRELVDWRRELRRAADAADTVVDTTVRAFVAGARVDDGETWP